MAGVTRTRDEARYRANFARAKILAGRPFDDVRGHYTDTSGTGDLGAFGPRYLVPPLWEALSKVEVGQVTEIVETDAGFFVLLRTR